MTCLDSLVYFTKNHAETRMFDRINLLNLDKRTDRLGSFKAKIIGIPLFKDFTRVRAVHGDTVTVPGFFISGGGAFGCRQSHLRILEDAMMDNIDTLLVLEDDVRFCPNFTEKLLEFMRRVPPDWNALMLGGQDHPPGPAPTDVEGIVRSRNTQRTHAYVVRGLPVMQDLYRLWSRADRHIDHIFGQFQQKWNVYQPQPFLCGQDETPSDISGRNDTVRFWNPENLTIDQNNTPIILLESPRVVAEGLRQLGFHFGYSREPLSGKDKGLVHIGKSSFPQDDLKKWVDLIIAEAADQQGIGGIWHPGGEMTEEVLKAKLTRPVKKVKATSVEEAVQCLPDLMPHFLSSRTIWCWRGEGVDLLEGMRHHGWHRGRWNDEVSGLDNGIRAMVKNGVYVKVRSIVRQLEREAMDVMYGKVLLAHPELDVELVRGEFAEDGKRVVELVGQDIAALVGDFQGHQERMVEMYGGGK